MALRNHLLAFAILVGAGCASSTTRSPNVAGKLTGGRAAQNGARELDAAAIDEMIRAEWKAQSILPSARIDDARFLRRAYIDVVGTIPTADAVLAFKNDNSQDKRAKLVASLLASPRYAKHWAVYWDDVLMGQKVREPRVDRAAFRAWLRDEFARDAKWNDLVYELVAATGQNSDGGPLKRQDYGFGMPLNGGGMSSAADAPEPETEAGTQESAPINPAVNWALKYIDAPQDFAGNASKTFLGVQIQCAQCHDHKTEKWKQADFQRFASCFARTQIIVLDKGDTMGNVRRVQIRDANRPLPRFTKNPDLRPIAQAAPAALDGADMTKSGDAREAMADWMTSDRNPWFAKAIVNRMWAHFLGRGFVDPIDDLRPSNPAAMPEVLDALAKDFVAHGYDLKRLVTLMTETEAYQLSSSPPPGGPHDAATAEAAHKSWARFRLAPMGPEELLDSAIEATDLEEAMAESNVNLEQVRAQLAKQYGFLFDVDEEFDHEAFEGTLAQALTLLNGSLTGSASSVLPGNALKEVLALPGDDREKIEALYLKTLSRQPSAAEVSYWVQYVRTPREKASVPATNAAPSAASNKASGGAPGAKAGKGDKERNSGGGNDPLRRLENKAVNGRHDARTEAYEDVLWALLNSSEFLFNH